VTRRLPLVLLSLILVLFVVVGAGLARVGGEKAYRYLNVFGDALQLIRSHYVDPVDDDELLAGAFEGMVGGRDGFSAYLDREEMSELQEPRGEAGTGLVLLPAGGASVVVAVRPDSPAERAGIKVGDQIWAIDDEPLMQLAHEQVLRRLSGAAGEVRRLRMLDGRTFQRRSEELTLERVGFDAFELSVREGGIALLGVADLERISLEDLAEELGAVQSRGAESLLLDLRSVVGGTPEQAASFLSLFLDGGTAARLSSRDGRDELVAVPAGGVAWRGDLRILTNGATAGAAELVGAALRERADALLVGESTYGLGALQELLTLDESAGVLLSTRSMTSPEGLSWHGEGLEPENAIEQTPEARRGDEPDGQLEAALEWVRRGAPVGFEPAAA
jgi:carboxyl-terminal processing protease